MAEDSKSPKKRLSMEELAKRAEKLIKGKETHKNGKERFEKTITKLANGKKQR